MAPGAATVSRVVAVGQSPITTSNITRLVSRGAPAFHPTASLLPASHCVTPDPSTCVYVPIRHVHTSERAMVPLHVHPITGACTPAAPPPNGFLPAPADGADKSPNFLQWLAGLLCSLDAKLELAKIYNWIVNSVAFGRLRDSTAHFLLTSPGWHAVQANDHTHKAWAAKHGTEQVSMLELVEDDEEDDDVCATCGPGLFNPQ